MSPPPTSSPITEILEETRKWTQIHREHAPVSRAAWRGAFDEIDPDWAELAEWTMELSTQVSVEFMEIQAQAGKTGPLLVALDQALAAMDASPSLVERLRGRAADRSAGARECEKRFAAWNETRQVELERARQALELAGLMDDAGQVLLEHAARVASLADTDAHMDTQASPRQARRRLEARQLASSAIGQIVPLLVNRSPQWSQMAKALRTSQNTGMQEVAQVLQRVQGAIEKSKAPPVPPPVPALPATTSKAAQKSTKPGRVFSGFASLFVETAPPSTGKVADVWRRLHGFQSDSVLRMLNAPVCAPRTHGAYERDTPSGWHFDPEKYQDDIQLVASTNFSKTFVSGVGRANDLLPASSILVRDMAAGRMKWWGDAARRNICDRLGQELESGAFGSVESLAQSDINASVWFAAALGAIQGGYARLGYKMILASPFSSHGVKLEMPHQVDLMDAQEALSAQMATVATLPQERELREQAAARLIKERVKHPKDAIRLSPEFLSLYQSREDWTVEAYAQMLHACILQNQTLPEFNFARFTKFALATPPALGAMESCAKALLTHLAADPQQPMWSLLDCGLVKMAQMMGVDPKDHPHLHALGALRKVMDQSGLPRDDFFHLARHASTVLLHVMQTQPLDFQWQDVDHQVLDILHDSQPICASMDEARCWALMEKQLGIYQQGLSLNARVDAAFSNGDFYLVSALAETFPSYHPSASMVGGMAKLFEASKLPVAAWITWLDAAKQLNVHFIPSVERRDVSLTDIVHAYAEHIHSHAPLAIPAYDEHCRRLSTWLTQAANQESEGSSVLSILKVATQAFGPRIRDEKDGEFPSAISDVCTAAILASLAHGDASGWVLTKSAIVSTWKASLKARSPHKPAIPIQGPMTLQPMTEEMFGPAMAKCRVFTESAVELSDLPAMIDRCRIDQWVVDHLPDTAIKGYPRPGMLFRARRIEKVQQVMRYAPNGEAYMDTEPNFAAANQEESPSRFNQCGQVQVSPLVSAKDAIAIASHAWQTTSPTWPELQKISLEGMPFMEAAVPLHAIDHLLLPSEKVSVFVDAIEAARGDVKKRVLADDLASLVGKDLGKGLPFATLRYALANNAIVQHDGESLALPGRVFPCASQAPGPPMWRRVQTPTTAPVSPISALLGSSLLPATPGMASLPAPVEKPHPPMGRRIRM